MSIARNQLSRRPAYTKASSANRLLAPINNQVLSSPDTSRHRWRCRLQRCLQQVRAVREKFISHELVTQFSRTVHWRTACNVYDVYRSCILQQSPKKINRQISRLFQSVHSIRVVVFFCRTVHKNSVCTASRSAKRSTDVHYNDGTRWRTGQWTRGGGADTNTWSALFVCVECQFNFPVCSVSISSISSIHHPAMTNIRVR